MVDEAIKAGAQAKVIKIGHVSPRTGPLAGFGEAGQAIILIAVTLLGMLMMVGIAGFIFMDSALAGSDRMAIDNMADYTVSSLKIRNPAYVDDIEGTPLDKGLARPGAALLTYERLAETVP